MAEKFKCEILRLPEIYDICTELALRIKESNFEIDMVVAIARGGFVPARLLCDFLNINNLTSLKVTHYHATEKGQEAKLQYPLNAEVKGKNILLVDDVNDTGKSLDVAAKHLVEKGAKECRIAVMHEKKGSILESDYHVHYIEDWHWIIYEWAVIEDVGSFISESDCSGEEECLNMLRKDYGIILDANELEKIMAFVKEKQSS